MLFALRSDFKIQAVDLTCNLPLVNEESKGNPKKGIDVAMILYLEYEMYSSLINRD